MVSDTVIISVVGFLAVALMNGYAAYWALGIRRALAVRLYRNQALGIGLVSLGFVGVVFGSTFAYQSAFAEVKDALQLLVFIIMFYWIDASIRAGRRSDPLLRDTFHWKLVRLPLWVLIIGFYLALIFSAYLFPELVNAISVPTILLVFFIPVLSGALILPVVARRSKDFTLRRHLQWFALLAVAYLVLLIGIFTIFPAQTGLSPYIGWADLWFFVGGYFLYRSAKSLVPLNRISKLEESKVGLPPP
jgi:hypothetical protein